MYIILLLQAEQNAFVVAFDQRLAETYFLK